MENDRFRVIEGYPPAVDAASVMVRLIDGLGFRFYWATHGLNGKDYSFQAVEGSMSIGETVSHIWGLVNWVRISLDKGNYENPADHAAMREEILSILSYLRDTFAGMKNEELASFAIHEKPFWHLINGPLADALTHTGQINLLRRLAGNPAARLNPFLGIAPDK
ncbi:hypothetical protein GF373_05920 [bacterium]|nr:hypothetical protein [bacterium]